MITLKALRVYPSTSNNEFVVEIHSEHKQSCEISLRSIEGKRVLTHFCDLVSGIRKIYLDIHMVEPGSYYIRSSAHPEEAIRVEVNK